MSEESEFSTKKIGYALTGYMGLTDEGMQYLVDVLFESQKERNKTECPLCGKKGGYKNHEKDCNQLSEMHI